MGKSKTVNAPGDENEVARVGEISRGRWASARTPRPSSRICSGWTADAAIVDTPGFPVLRPLPPHRGADRRGDARIPALHRVVQVQRLPPHLNEPGLRRHRRREKGRDPPERLSFYQGSSSSIASCTTSTPTGAAEAPADFIPREPPAARATPARRPAHSREPASRSLQLKWHVMDWYRRALMMRSMDRPFSGSGASHVIDSFKKTAFQFLGDEMHRSEARIDRGNGCLRRRGRRGRRAGGK